MNPMHLTKEDLDKKQDEVADELCALLERAGRGGESSRQFEIPEYARRRIDMSLSAGKLIGHFKSLVITDWKRKDHHEGNVPEERIAEHDILVGVALVLKKFDLRVFRDQDAQNLYVLGIENYGGIPVRGFDEGQLYALYVSNHSDESWDITSDGTTIASCVAEMRGKTLMLVTKRGNEVELVPFDLTEKEYVSEMKEKSEKGKSGK
jgi:hypothetical protein